MSTSRLYPIYSTIRKGTMFLSYKTMSSPHVLQKFFVDCKTRIFRNLSSIPSLPYHHPSSNLLHHLSTSRVHKPRKRMQTTVYTAEYLVSPRCFPTKSQHYPNDVKQLLRLHATSSIPRTPVPSFIGSCVRSFDPFKDSWNDCYHQRLIMISAKFWAVSLSSDALFGF